MMGEVTGFFLSSLIFLGFFFMPLSLPLSLAMRSSLKVPVYGSLRRAAAASRQE